AERAVAVGAQLGLLKRVLEVDERPGVLLACDYAVRDTERARAPHGGMVLERVLDARRVDVAAAAEDERIGAAAELERAVGAQEAQVAGRVGAGRELDELAERRHIAGAIDAQRTRSS